MNDYVQRITEFVKQISTPGFHLHTAVARDIMLQIKPFLHACEPIQFCRSREFHDNHMTAYIRAGKTLDRQTREWVPGITVVRVDVEPDARRTGCFKRFMTGLEEVAQLEGYRLIKVELVHSEILRECLPRYGYERDHLGQPLDSDQNLFEYHFVKKLNL